jgi:predicted phosphodiesterase
MKLAIISDIHGNMHALEAVIIDLQCIGPDRVIANGDLVGRGPQSQEVLETARNQRWQCIKGNHEEFWTQCGHGDRPPEWEESWWTPTRLQIEHMDSGWFDWMAALPTEHIIAVPGMPAVQIVHGSPRRTNEGLYAHIPERALLESLGATRYPVIVGAHTHYPMDRRAGNYRVLNCGSVGAPFNGNPAAQYLLLTGRQGEWIADFRQVPYDCEAALRFWRASGYCASGVAAQVFAYELETATFHFWHYVRFCEVIGLSYNKPASFARYQAEFPIYRAYCAEHNLPLHEIDSLIAFRDRPISPG